MPNQSSACHPALVAGSGITTSDGGFFLRSRNKYVMTSYVLLLTLILPLTACGIKGSLKTPAQIERQEAKEVRRAQKKMEKQEADKQEAVKKLDSKKEATEKK